ncbi:uncharacterized protein DS421_3g105400 [Arachis hypogaea]|nr:uncharacterized protein DS421_3g105400 [Arachis hypogaea]
MGNRLSEGYECHLVEWVSTTSCVTGDGLHAQATLMDVGNWKWRKHILYWLCFERDGLICRRCD